MECEFGHVYDIKRITENGDYRGWSVISRMADVVFSSWLTHKDWGMLSVRNQIAVLNQLPDDPDLLGLRELLIDASDHSAKLRLVVL